MGMNEVNQKLAKKACLKYYILEKLGVRK